MRARRLKNPKLRFLEIQAKALIAQLGRLTKQLEDPNLTDEKVKAIRAEVEECQKKLKELGISRD